MATLYMRTYTDKACNIFHEYRGQLEKLLSERDRIDADSMNTYKDTMLSIEGKKQKRETLACEREKVKEQMERLADSMKAEYANLRNKVDAVFGELYKVNPNAIDNNVMMLINSGILSDVELMEFTKGYDGNNPTMYRLCADACGKRANETGNAELRHISTNANARSYTPHTDAIDQIAMIATLGMRYDGTSETVKGNGIAKNFDALSQNAVNSVANVSVGA